MLRGFQGARASERPAARTTSLDPTHTDLILYTEVSKAILRLPLQDQDHRAVLRFLRENDGEWCVLEVVGFVP